MMLRSLVDEVVRRRLWPIPLVAILVAIAAPVLFMKSAPAGAPAPTEAPPAATPGKLPGTAKVLVTTSDKAVAPRQTSRAGAQDPFAPPRSAVKAKGTSAEASGQPAGAQTASTPKPIPLVTPGADAKKRTVSPAKTKEPSASKQAKKKPAAKKPAVKKEPARQPSVPASKVIVYVDVRFSERAGSKARRRIPRIQLFRAGGKVAAIFVKYSPSRRKAVFAIAPSTKVSGDVKCRRKEGVCRYVDIPEGKFVRLTLRGTDGSLVSRRLDVVSIHGRRVAAGSAPATAPRSTPLDEARCLLRRLLSLSPAVPSISADACA